MTPFTNKVHLATIAFVVILFAAFRGMGGAFSVERAGPVSGSPASESQRGTESFKRERLRAPQRDINLPNSELLNSELLNSELLNSDSQKSGASYPGSSYSAGSYPSGDDEIEGAVKATPSQTRPTQQQTNDLDEIIRKLNSR